MWPMLTDYSCCGWFLMWAVAWAVNAACRCLHVRFKNSRLQSSTHQQGGHPLVQCVQMPRDEAIAPALQHWDLLGLDQANARLWARIPGHYQQGLQGQTTASVRD